MSRRDKWLLLASILMLAGVCIYYVAPVVLGKLGGRKAAGKPPTAEAPRFSTEGVAGNMPRGEAGAKIEARVSTEIVDEETPWGRNPFLREAETTKEKSPMNDALKVKAIITGRARPVATIDGRTVVVGEMVGEERVVEIRPDAVILEREGRRKVLRVSEPSISIEVMKGER